MPLSPAPQPLAEVLPRGDSVLRPRRRQRRGIVSVASTLQRLGGCAATAELRVSHSKRQIAAAVSAGEIHRSATGRYASPAVEQHRRIAHERTAALSHLSAAAAYGWRVKSPPREVSLTVPRGRQRRRGDSGVVTFWSDLSPAEVRAGITSPLRTVLDCARTLPFDEAVSVADSALRALAVTQDDLVVAASRLRGPGAAAARRVASFADGRAANPFESTLRVLAAKVPGLRLVPQTEIWGPGIYAIVDLADERLRLAVEAEGFEFHGTRKGLHRDCRRHTELALLGWSVLRFSWEDVMLHPDRVVWALSSWLAVRRGADVTHPPR